MEHSRSGAEAASTPPQQHQPQQQHSQTTSSGYDICVIDAFDGRDDIPESLTAPGGPFLRALSEVLDPDFGAVVLNTHGGDPPPGLFESLAAVASGGRVAPRGFSTNKEAGRKVASVALACRDAVLLRSRGDSCAGGAGPASSSSSSAEAAAKGKEHSRVGEAFTLATQHQDNVR